MSSKERIQYIHLFRGVAILFIVMSHLIWSTGDHPEIKRSIRLILSNSTIFFLIISGFLFEHLSNNYKPVPYIIKKIKFILLPYIFCSIPIMIFLLIRSPEQNLSTQALNYLFTGSHLGPFWYMPVIMAFFLISPLIIFLKQFKIFQVALIFTLLYSIISKRPESYNVIYNLTYYFGFFHLGIVMALHRNTIEKWFGQKIILAMMSVAWVIIYFSLVNNASFAPLRTIQLILLGFILMNICYHINDWYLIKSLSLLAEYSFGIYFLHQYIINALAIIVSKFGINYQNLFYSIIIYPIVLLVSIFLIYTTKQIVGQKTSRYFVGS